MERCQNHPHSTILFVLIRNNMQMQWNVIFTLKMQAYSQKITVLHSKWKTTIANCKYQVKHRMYVIKPLRLVRFV